MGKHAITNTARIDAQREEFLNRWSEFGIVVTTHGDRAERISPATERAEIAAGKLEEVHPHIVSIAINSLHTAL